MYNPLELAVTLSGVLGLLQSIFAQGWNDCPTQEIGVQVLQDGGFVESFAVTWGATPNLPGPEAPLPLRSEARGGELFQARRHPMLRV